MLHTLKPPPHYHDIHVRDDCIWISDHKCMVFVQFCFFLFEILWWKGLFAITLLYNLNKLAVGEV